MTLKGSDPEGNSWRSRTPHIYSGSLCFPLQPATFLASAFFLLHLSAFPLSAFSAPLLFFFFFCFLEPHLWHMEVPRLGVKAEPQLPAYTNTRFLTH